MAITSEQEAFAVGLIDGALSVFENADRLFYEAGVLAEVEAFSRGYLLHQISLEECGKIEMLCAAVCTCLLGNEVDVKSLSRAFRRHEGKNKMNAYFLPRSEAEKVAEENNDIAAAVGAFKAVQEEFHQESNRLKNSSLYVDFDGEFISPQNVISKDDYEKIHTQNAEFMGLTNLKVQMLSRWRADITSAASEVQEVYALVAESRPEGESLTESREVLWERIEKAFGGRGKGSVEE